MIFGTHVLLYSDDPAADRAFFRDVLGLRSVDVGHGWLIFGLPPSEIAVHPNSEESENNDRPVVRKHAGHEMLGAHVYFMCDDLQVEVRAMKAKGVNCSEIEQATWGNKMTIRLPSGGEIGLYEPKHETALNLR
ncbi:MAG: VOC family protein [Planctomycetes bacterium]|nr:VOC family protein [Planctomycetota bacterium]MBI3833354.1 VOC family protein [Planctomycetota bacterium]